MGDILLMLIIVAGFAIALYLYNEKIIKKKAAAEREREQEAQKLLNGARNILEKIMDSYLNVNGEFSTVDDSWSFKGEYESVYNGVWSIQSKLKSFKNANSYLEQFNKLITEHIKELKSDISKYVSKIINNNSKYPAIHLICIFHKLQLLKSIENNNSIYDTSINKIEETIDLLDMPMYFLVQNKYGDFTLPLDSIEEMKRMSKVEYDIKENLTNMIKNISNNSDGNFCGIKEFTPKTFLNISAKLMWYYAKKEPFDVNNFNIARSIYEIFTLGEREFISKTGTLKRNLYRVKKETIKLEELLAIIYSKLMMGGSAIVQQQLKLIDKWIEDDNHREYEVEILASALSWMELYDLECHVLKKMVEKDIQMKPEVQKRLKFLLSGGTSNVTVYEIEKQKNFIFDSSSENWNVSNEFSVFFRKVAMKNININYSLAISSWKKSLPLMSGQSVSMDDIYSEFQKMIKDFDGEVTCKRTIAQAIDLENVTYKDVVLFSFTSERNKCLSILFACEKFGRTLNITIITLFTPEDGVDTETLQKYAVAIKSNIYVDSFRETILQSVDEVIKEEQNIYDDDVPSSSKKFVE